jgi:hypothetical protein
LIGKGGVFCVREAREDEGDDRYGSEYEESDFADTSRSLAWAVATTPNGLG